MGDEVSADLNKGSIDLFQRHGCWIVHKQDGACAKNLRESGTRPGSVGDYMLPRTEHARYEPTLRWSARNLLSRELSQECYHDLRTVPVFECCVRVLCSSVVFECYVRVLCSSGFLVI